MLDAINMKLSELGMVMTSEPEFDDNGVAQLFRPKDAPKTFNPDQKFFANFAGILRTIRPAKFDGEVNKQAEAITRQACAEVARKIGVSAERVEEIVNLVDRLREKAYLGLEKNPPNR